MRRRGRSIVDLADEIRRCRFGTCEDFYDSRGRLWGGISDIGVCPL